MSKINWSRRFKQSVKVRVPDCTDPTLPNPQTRHTLMGHPHMCKACTDYLMGTRSMQRFIVNEKSDAVLREVNRLLEEWK